MATVTTARESAKSEVTIMDAMPVEWQGWARKYLDCFRRTARQFPRQGEAFHQLVARMHAGPMPAYPLPKPAYRSTAKLAEENPEAFERMNDAWQDYPAAPPMTEDDMAEMAHYYGQD